MLNNKTQQFAKFFIKDLKAKKNKYGDEKSDFNELTTSSAGWELLYIKFFGQVDLQMKTR